MGQKVEKITVDMQAGRLLQDLERYRERALELGATHAKIVKTEDIPVDERVTLKCQIPRCFGYGVSAHCPPHTMKPAELQDLLKKYRWAVFFTMDVPPG
jgi:predicted metal-binding protein